MNKPTVILLLLLIALPGFAGLSIHLEKKLAIGDGEFMFDSLVSICEDGEGNFYALDFKAYKVHKFSPGGKLLLSFGRKGEGPGEFKSPGSIYYAPEGKIIVAEMMNQASVFDTNGKFLDRYSFLAKMSMSFAVGYAGNELFCVQKRDQNRDRSQIIIDSKGNIINSSLFKEPYNSIQYQNMSYTYSTPEYSRELLFSYYWNRSALARSDEYKILLLDDQGKIERTITRKVKRPELSSKEREYLNEQLKGIKMFPKPVKSIIRDRTPDVKNFMEKIFLTKTHLFVIRVRKDVSRLTSPVPVDIFDLEGKFMGSFTLKKTPTHISDHYIYITGRNEADDIMLFKYKYKLQK